jgi:prevent-host-death family protein
MVEVSVHEAKTQLSRLLRRVEAGEEVIIRRGHEPVAELVALRDRPREFGRDRDAFQVPEDFDGAPPAEILEAFEG